MAKIAGIMAVLAVVSSTLTLPAATPPANSTQQARPREDLQAELDDPHPWTRLRAAIELADSGDTSAIEPLARILEDIAPRYHGDH